jgi:uncharacterized protein YutE (UPF0331/DUF86 family)
VASETSDFDKDPYLRDIVERNLEIAAQCCIDVSNRIISLEAAQKPIDYYDAILRMGELEVLAADFARHLAPLAGFRNILVHEYLAVDWDQVFRAPHHPEELEPFAECVRRWLAHRTSSKDNLVP